MTVIPIFLIAILALLLLSGSACSRTTAGNTPSSATTTVTTAQVGSLSKQKLEDMLSNLEKKKAPNPKMGAMCYDMVGVSQRAEYICPACGEKTLYTSPQAGFVEMELQGCRREFEAIRKNANSAMKLDESSFCKKCSPNAKGAGLGLFVTYTDGTKHGITPVTHDDLRILRDFLNGKRSYTIFNDGEMPLKNSLPRLRQLLGLPQNQEHNAKGMN